MAKITQRLGLPRYEADEYYKRALAAFDKGDYDQAIDNLDKAIDVLPTRSEYYAARGYVFLNDGVKEKAEAEFEEALKMHEGRITGAGCWPIRIATGKMPKPPSVVRWRLTLNGPRRCTIWHWCFIASGRTSRPCV